MAMVGWMGAVIEVVGGMYVGQSPSGWLHVGRCRSTSRVRGETPMKPGLSTGRHEKAPVRCPFSQLASLHGALRTLLLSLSKQLHRRLRCVAAVVQSLEDRVLPSTAPTSQSL